jgi:ABC-type nitrate/sulfonate/bicarbonate transport system permease component
MDGLTVMRRCGIFRTNLATAGGVLHRIGPIISVAIILSLWELATQLKLVIPFLLPAPGVVAARIAADLTSGALLVNASLTLFRALAGFALAAVAGIAIGVLMSRVAWVRWFCDPLVSIGLPTPQIALLPVFMVWFGLNDTSKILMAAFSAVFTVIIATWTGTQMVDKQIVWSAKSLGASPRQVLWEIVLPAALPQIITGLEVALPLCLIVVVVCEMKMGGRGLGTAMIRSARYADSPGVFAGIFEIAGTGFMAIKVLQATRRRMLTWHAESEKDTTA